MIGFSESAAVVVVAVTEAATEDHHQNAETGNPDLVRTAAVGRIPQLVVPGSWEPDNLLAESYFCCSTMVVGGMVKRG